MEARAKRSVLTAFLLSVLAPCSGLLYVHRPRARLGVSAVSAGGGDGGDQRRIVGLVEGDVGCLAVGGAAWLYALLASLLLAREGLAPDEARHDIGPWIVAYLALSFILAWVGDRPGYTGYRVTGEAMEPALVPGDYVLARRVDAGTKRPAGRFGSLCG